jgi:hypothetical protein
MLELKPLSRDAIPAALAKAERYRLLNEPGEAESICLDVLRMDPGNQQALVTLLLALTDQFGEGRRALMGRARDVLPLLRNEYDRVYYAGIIAERRAKVLLASGGVRIGSAIYEWLSEAMSCYEQAEAIRSSGNDDAILRWNACARIIQQNPQLEPVAEERSEPLFLE